VRMGATRDDCFVPPCPGYAATATGVTWGRGMGLMSMANLQGPRALWPPDSARRMPARSARLGLRGCFQFSGTGRLVPAMSGAFDRMRSPVFAEN